MPRRRQDLDDVATVDADAGLATLLTRDKVDAAIVALTELLRTAEVQRRGWLRQPITAALRAVDELFRLTL